LADLTNNVSLNPTVCWWQNSNRIFWQYGDNNQYQKWLQKSVRCVMSAVHSGLHRTRAYKHTSGHARPWSAFHWLAAETMHARRL